VVKMDGEFGADENEAMPEFYRRGWRARRDNCYCPKCAKKLKKKK